MNSRQQSSSILSISILRRLPGFVLVGGVGFLIDAGILTALMKSLDFGHYGARAISFTIAVTATWYMNRRWVFERNAVHMSRREYTAYLSVQVIGALINLSVFAAVIELVPDLTNAPVIPLAVGAAVALMFNFAASSRFVFSDDNNQKTDPGESLQ